jgi:methylase of polypeptide subunit release factors
MTTRLLASLTRVLGVPQARQELKWMQQAASASATLSSLDEMVRRRSLGEPLQYILGATILVQDVFTFSF